MWNIYAESCARQLKYHICSSYQECTLVYMKLIHRPASQSLVYYGGHRKKIKIKATKSVAY